ncbi:ribonuclease P protein component [Patescibacteria group bacterium]|nr:ribonuclease P protein component [Patescibacteria group bacterium]
MLAKINRLKKRKDFDLVFKRGKGFKEDFLVLKMIRNNLNQTRFGFIVGGKISKKATLRNRIKRRLRELIRMKLKRIKKGFDLILIAQTGLENKDFWEIEEIINKLFSKAKII